MGPCLQHIRNGPCDDDEESDEGDIGIPVRHGLRAHLHDAYDGDEGAQVPEPAYCRVGAFLCRLDGQHGESYEDR